MRDCITDEKRLNAQKFNSWRVRLKGIGAIVEEKDRTGVQVIRRALAIIDVLADEAAPLSVLQLSERLGLARTTVQRIVGALIDEKVLMSTSARGAISLGPTLARWGAAANSAIDVVAIAQPIMEDLSRHVGETVDLSILNSRSALFISQVVKTKRLAAVSQIGERFPLHSTANGKAMLALLTSSERRKLVGEILEPDTINTITGWRELTDELMEIDQRGVAFDREEHTLGVCAVGTALRAPNGDIYALSIPIPAIRFARPEDLIAPLLEARDKLQARFGEI